MIITLIDGYTDEPSGLGVPPYLGVYPRYICGAALQLHHQFYYLRIDDLRFYFNRKEEEINRKTNIFIKNRTKHAIQTEQILKDSDVIIVVAGIHTPGKYLSAMPGSITEISNYIKNQRALKILTGPAAFSSLPVGGRKLDLSYFKEIKKTFDKIIPGDLYAILKPILENKAVNQNYKANYSELRDKAILGAKILNQINQPTTLEIETGKGCNRRIHCSFCLEPIKNKNVSYRDVNDIIDEVLELKKYGGKYFRLGKQSDIYAYPKIKELLKGINNLQPQVFHIDNANPVSVISEQGRITTKLLVKYCTSGNVAAFGVESFDENVIKSNNLNSSLKTTIKAIEIINREGSKTGENGAPLFLPGINLILGLINENKETLNKNLEALKYILNKGLLLRRINIRQVDVFPGTKMYEFGTKYLKKNKKYYFSFRKKVRTEIDYKMLKKIFPNGKILKNVYMEIYDGNHTFGRQFGSYPIVVGINKRVPLNCFYDVKITGHMLRSITAEILKKTVQPL